MAIYIRMGSAVGPFAIYIAIDPSCHIYGDAEGLSQLPSACIKLVGGVGAYIYIARSSPGNMP